MTAIRPAPAATHETGVYNDATLTMRGVFFGLLFSAVIWILAALVAFVIW